MWRHALVMVLALASIGIGKEIPPKEGTYYTLGQLGIRDPQVKGGRLDLTFKPIDEQFYWCPGIKVKQTKVAVVVTFIRCKTSQSCGVDVQAAIGKRMIRNVSINTNGMDVYVRDGPKRFKRIYKSPNSKVQKSRKQSKTAENRTTNTQKSNESRDEAETKSGKQTRTTLLIQPTRHHVLKRDVRNYLSGD